MSDTTVLRATVLEGIEEVARRHLDWQGAVRREMRLVEDLELDSMRLFVLAAEVENHFRIALDEADELRLVTVGDLADLILRKLKPRDPNEPTTSNPTTSQPTTSQPTTSKPSPGG